MILETRQLDFRYDDGTHALDKVSIAIETGEFVVLMGPNGSGKTTLFKLLTGLLQATSGEVLVAGETIASIKKEILYRKIGFVFQDPNDQLFAPTVAEDVAFGPANLDLSAKEVNARVDEALGRVGMLKHKRKVIHNLSYGQKKRVSIAGVLAMEPEIIMLDEPTAGLDPGGVQEIMSLLTELNNSGITILMASHDVDLVPIYADKIFVLYEGNLILQGKPREVFENKDIIRHSGLRLPRVAHLGEILNNKDKMPMDRLPLTIGEARRLFNGMHEKNGGQNGKEKA